ncbi:MAG: hypothetical protein LBC99_08190 [Spirochaetota bacterium]|jgi:hypothetical protein|nr:hypothetical protein [Spirochaetota bacterium]
MRVRPVLYAVLFCAIFLCFIGCKTQSEKRAVDSPNLWVMEKGTGYALELQATATINSGDRPFRLSAQVELYAKADAKITAKTDKEAVMRLVLAEREFTVQSSPPLVQEWLQKSLVLPGKGEALDLHFEPIHGRLRSYKYRSAKGEYSSAMADFGSLLAFPNLRVLTQPFPAVYVQMLGNTRISITGRDIDQSASMAANAYVLTNAIRIESDDGRGARGRMAAYQAFHLQPGRVLAAWGNADFDTRTALPGMGLQTVIPLSWHIEYVCRYTKL